MKRRTPYWLLKTALILLLSLAPTSWVWGQCDPTVPTYTIDLSGNPDSVWYSPNVARVDNCCGTSHPDNCIKFIVTLDSNAVGINLDIFSGAVPGGALFWQVSCSGSNPVGDDICLNGAGPHEITFCKPGNNPNVYSITSIPGPAVSDPIIVSEACIDTIFATSLVEDSIVWRAVPANATYDTYLSATSGEDTVTVTPTGSYPSFVDYEVCGDVIGSCGSIYFCDTVRVTFVSNFAVTILPDDPAVCFGGAPVEIYAQGSGGATPYTYLWSTGETTDTIDANLGTYTVQAFDSLGCTAVFDTVFVDSFSVAITANAGNDTFMCGNLSNINLLGTITGASGGTWYNGAGIYSPSADSLDLTYTPDALERTLGQFTLYLMTTGNKNCPGDTDNVKVTIYDNPIPVINGNDTACQYEPSYFSVPSPGLNTIEWNAPGGMIQGTPQDNPVTIVWTDTGQQTVSLRLIDPVSGCDSTVTTTVYVSMSPIETISGDDTTCQLETNVYSVPAQAGFQYQWVANGGTIIGLPTSSSTTVQWTDTGSVSVLVKITNLAGCDTTITLNVYSSIKPRPVITGNDSTCLNKIYTYSLTPSAGHTYQWSVSGGTIYGDSTSSSIAVLWHTLGTGTVSLTQTNSLGCDTAISTNVEVLYTPSPVISAPNDTACENKIYSYSITPAAGETFSWGVSGGSIIGSSTGSSINVLWGSPGTGTITVTQTSSFGCDSTISTNITIVQTPKPVITLPNDSACQNKIYTYSVPSVGGETYVWNVSGGQFIGDSTNNTVNVMWGVPGTGTISVTQTSAFGCDSTVSANVTIVYTPTPALTPPADTACANKIYNYALSSTLAGETYLWTVSGGQIIGDSTGNNINVLWGGAGTGTIAVTQTSAFGCDSTISENVTIVVTPTPVITLPNDSACQNKISVYSVSSVAGNTYDWSVSGGQIIGDSTSNSVNILWGTPGTGTVLITQTSAFGCDSTVSENVTIVYTPAPVIVLPNDTACENKIYTYSVTPSAGETFSWGISGGTILGSTTGSSINVLWAAPGTGTLTVTQTSAFGCDSTVSENVTIVQTPKPVINLPNDSACEYKIVNYSVTAVSGETYVWNVTGGTFVGDSTLSSVNVLWGANGGGTISVTQTSAFGCDSTVSESVTIVPTPAPTMTIPNDSACQNNIYTYSTTVLGGNTYEWTVYGGQIIGDSTGGSINVLWSAPDSGVVSLTVTNSFGCDSTIHENITIMYTPTSGMTIPDDTLCALNLYAYYFSPQGTGESYQWQVNGGSIVGSSTDTVCNVLWGAAGMGYIEVQVTTAFGCDSLFSDSVFLAPTPFPNIIGQDTGCEGQLFTYYTDYIPGHDYTWTVTGGTVIGGTDSAVVNVIWGSSGTGYLSVFEYAPNTCDSTVYDTISIFPTPDPTISLPNDSACQNKIVAYSVTNQAGMTYDWDITGGQIIGDSTSNAVNVLWGSPGTGTVTITQTSPAGCDSTVSADVTIVYTPAPSLTPPDDTACESKIYTYSITPTAGGETYSWSVSGGTILSSTTDTFITVIWGTPGTGVIQVTETSAFGCDSTISDSILIIQTPKPVINLPNDTACQNKIETYSVTAVSGETYVWSVSGGQFIGDSTSNAVNVLWGSPGIGTLTVTQTSSFGCDSTITDTVTIVYTPMPVISLPNDTACENKIYNYSITPSAGESFQWTVSGGAIIGDSTGDNINVLWAGPGTGSVTVTQISAFGCDSSVTENVTIVQTPKPVIVLPNDTACQNKIETYTVTAVSGETYVWSVSGGQFIGDSTSNSVNVLWGAPGTGTLTVTQTSSFGCDSTVSENVTIVYTPMPVISLPNDTACENKIYNYSITPSAGETFQWTVSGGAIIGDSTGDNINVLWAGPGTGSVTVTQISAFGCDSSVTENVTIVQTPKPVINLPNDTACQNKIETYTVTAVSGETYVWSVSGGQFIGDSTSNSVNVLWGAPGTGTLTVTQTSSFGCDSTVSENVTIVYTPMPVISLPNDTACENKIYNYSITPSAGETFSWSVSGGSIIGSTTGDNINVLWAAPGTGSITVTQISAFGCDSSVTENVIIVQTPKPVIVLPNDTACQNKIETYTVTAVSGETYVWSVSGGQFIGDSTSNSVNVLWGAPGTGTLTVTQTSSFGCDSTVSENVTIVYTPMPVISLPNDTACENKIYNYSITPSAGETFSWSVNGGSIIGSSTGDNINVLWAGPGTGSVTVTQISAFGCDSSVTENVTIVQTPKPVINLPNDTACQNKIETYTVTAVSGETYVWSVSGGQFIGDSTSNSVNVLWGAPGTGTLTVTQTSSFGCDSTVSENVTIVYTPMPVISLPNDTACENKIYNYSITPSAGETFSWSVSGGSIIGSTTGDNINVLWAGPGTGSVTVTQISAFGCDSSVTENVTIVQTPKPVIVLPNDTACQNKIETYTVTAVSGETYVWSVSGGQFIGDSTSNSVNVLWGVPGTGTLTVTQTSSFGCDSTVSENVTIVYTPMPVISLPNDTACENKIYNYSITPSAGETFSWSVSGGSIIGSTTGDNINVLWAGPGTGSVTVTQISAFGCDSSVTENVTIVQTPKPVIVLPNDTACQNKIETYTVTAVSGETYVWSVSGGQFIGDSTSNSVNVLWGAPGTGTLTVTQTSSFGCDSTVSENVTIVYTPMPVISLPNDTACENKIYNYSITPSAGETFSWSVSGGSIIGSTTGDNINVLWAAPGTGSITVTQISAFGCDSSVTENVTIVQTPKPVIVLPNDTACQNKIETYTVTAVSGETYVWSVSGGQFIGDSTSNSVNVLWGAPGTGTLTVTQTSSFGCDSTVSENVTIVHTPMPVISLPNDTACENKIYNYSITPSAGETFSWSVSGGSIIGSTTGDNINVLWAGPGTGSVTVTQISAFGCDSSVTENVTIVQTPKPVINLPNDTACQNKIETYTVTAVSGESYVWSVSGGQFIGDSTSNSVNVLWGTPGTGTLTVTQTSSFGCDSTVSENVTIVYTPMPVISLPNDTACENKIYNYSITPSAGETFSWSVSGGSIIGSTTGDNINVLWAAPGTGSVTVTQISAFGCDSSVTENVTIVQTPKPVINLPNDTACQNKIETYTVTAVSGETYVWSVSGGQFIGDSTSNSVNVLWGAPGTGTLTVTQTSSFGCDSTVSENVTIVYTPMPVISLPNDTACENKIYTYHLADSIKSLSNQAGFVWSNNPNTNYGSCSYMRLNNYDGYSYVGFDLSTVGGNIDSVIFNIYKATQNVALSGRTVNMYKITGNWNEGVGCGTSANAGELTYSNQPSHSASPDASWTQQAPGTWVKVDVTASVKAAIANGESSIGWYLQGTGGCSCTEFYATNDSAGFEPFLDYKLTSTPNDQYNWTVTNGSIIGRSDTTFVNVLWSSPGTGTLTVTQESAFGCDSSVTENVTIVQTPKPVIVLPNDTACQNKIETYSITAVSGETYVWSVSGGQFIGDSTTNSVNVLWGAPGTGTLTVTQTSSFGCDSTVSENVTIVYTPMPVISLPNDTACENKIYNYSITPSAGETFSWSVSGGSIIGSTTGDNINVLWAGPGTGSVTVTQISAFGCDSSVTENVTIVQTPKPVIVLPNDTACQNKIETYSITAVSGETYVWSVSGGQFIGDSTSNSVNVLWGAPGTGTLTVTQTSSFGCDSTVSENVTIVYTPMPVISLPNDTACENKIYNYSITPSAGETFSWSVSGGSIIGSTTGDNINVLWAGPGTGSVTVTQISAFGCDSSVTENVTIVQTPKPVIVLPNDTACQNKIETYTVTAVSGETYVWSVSGGQFIGDSTSNSVNVLWGVPGTGTLTVTQTSSFGCDSTVSENVTIVYTPMPVISLPNDTACQNKIYNYSVTPAAGESFLWTVSGGQIIGDSTGNNINVLWAAPGTGSITVTQISAFGCDSSVTENVTIVYTPSSGITLPNDTLCAFNIYTYSFSPQASGETYQWAVSGGAIIGSHTDTICHVLWGAAGMAYIEVEVISAFGCDSLFSDSVFLSQTPFPQIVGEDSSCQNKVYTYSTNYTSGHAYSWTVNGGTVIGGTDSAVINVLWGAPGTGYLSVMESAPNTCDSTTYDTITILPTPTPEIIMPNDTACENKIYTYNVPSHGPGESYQWSVIGGAIIGPSDDSVVNILWGAAGTGLMQIEVISALGCDSTIVDSLTIVPTPKPDITMPNDTACQNKIYTYSIAATSGHTYSWSINGGQILSSTTADSVVVLWGAPGTGSLTVTQISEFGCDSTITENVTIVQTPKPIIQLPNDTACENKIYTYAVLPVFGESYLWQVSGGQVVGDSTNSSVNILWAGPGTGTISLTQTSSFGCDSTVSENITIVYTPAPVISLPNDTACENKIYNYSITPAAGETFGWTVTGGQIIGDSTGDNINVLWAGPGTGTITVTQISPFDCDSSVTESVTIVQTPKPIINLPNDTACQNKIYTYSVTAVAGETYAWTVSGGQIISDTSSNSIEVLWGVPGSGLISLTQVSSYGCDSTVSENITIVYTPAPEIVMPDDTACENKIYTYSVPSDGPNETYQWSVIGGQIIGIDTDTLVNILWAGPGTGYIELIQRSVFGCDSTILDSVIIVQTPKPIIDLPNDTACQNKIYSYSVPFVSGETYLWAANGGQIIGSNTDTLVNILWGSPGLGTVSLTQTSIHGCDSLVSSDIRIVPTPAPVITGDTDVCQNKIYTYSITPQAGHSYQWSAVGGTVVGSSNLASASIMWGTPGAGVVVLTQTSEYGCDSTVTDTVEITRTPMPTIIGADTVCQDKVMTYHVDSVTMDSYNWSVSGGSILTTSNDTFILVKWGASGIGTVSLQQTSNLGCDSTVSVNILIQPTPQPIMVGDTNPCQDKVYTYQVTAQANHAYQWAINGGHFVGDSLNYTVNVIWDTTAWGTISLTMISPEGCDSTITDSVYIRPTPRASISGDDTSCQNDIKTYRVSSDPNWSYSWNVSGGQVIGSSFADSIHVLWTNTGTGNISISIINTDGCDTVILVYPVLVKDKPTPVINGQGVACRYKTYLYSTPTFPGATFTWEAVGGSLIGINNNSSALILWDSAATNIVRLTVMNDQGCDSTIERVIPVVPSPVPVITGPSVPCENELTGYGTFISNVTQITGQLTYNWQVNGGNVVGPNNNSTAVIRWSGVGLSTVILTVTTQAGCDSVVTFDVNVQPAPLPVINGPDSVCNNRFAQYNAQAINGHHYKWSAQNGTIMGSDTETFVMVHWGAPGAGILTLNQLNDFGCDSTSTKTVVIPPSPNPVITGDTPVCAYSVHSYAVTNLPGHTYNWSVIGGQILGPNTGNSVAILWGQAGTGRLTITQISNVGCDSTIQMDIRINPLPKAKITGESFACSNSQSKPFYQEDYKVPPKPNIRYDWSVVGGTIVGPPSSDSVIIKWGVSGNHPIYLRSTDTVTGCFSEDTFYVQVGIIQEPTIIANDFSICVPDNVQFNNGTPVDSLEYEWEIIGSNLQKQKVENPTFQIVSPSTYTVRVIVKNKYGCADTAEAQVVAEGKPIAEFEVLNKNNLMLGDTAYFINLTQGATDYEWIFHDQDIKYDFEPSKYYPEPGTYKVTLIARTGVSSCPDTTEGSVTIRVDPDILVPNAFTPNGDNRNDTWTVDMYYILEMEVIIFNRWGEIIFQSTDMNFQWDGTYKGVPVQEDVYAYYIRARGFNNELVVKKGNVSVIR